MVEKYKSYIAYHMFTNMLIIYIKLSKKCTKNEINIYKREEILPTGKKKEESRGSLKEVDEDIHKDTGGVNKDNVNPIKILRELNKSN